MPSSSRPNRNTRNICTALIKDSAVLLPLFLIGAFLLWKVWHDDEYPLLAQLAGFILISLVLYLTHLYLRQQRRTEEADHFASSLLEIAPVMVVGLDAEGRVVLLNEAAEKLCGYPAQDIRGRNWFELTAGENAADFSRHYCQAMARGHLPRTSESLIHSQSGQQRLISWQNCFFGGQSNPVAGVSFGLDITDSRRAEAALRQSEATLRRAQELAHTGSWSLDFQTGEMSCSEETLRIFGNPPEGTELLGHLRAMVHPEDRPALLSNWRQAIHPSHGESSTRFVHRHRIIQHNQVKWVQQTADISFDTKGRPLLGLGTVQDITEPFLVTQHLAEAREFNETIVAASPTGIAVFTAEGQCLLANPAASQILGMTEGELKQQNLWSNPAWQEAGFTEAAWAALNTQASTRSEARIPSDEGRDIWVEEVFTPVVINGTPHLLTLFTDIGKFREAEQAQRLAAQAAEAANRAKSEFLANISHEIRTPMNAIMGLTHLARSESDPATVQSYLTQVHSASQSLLDVLNNLLDYARIDAGKLTLDPQPFKLEQVLTACLDIYRPQAADKGVAITLQSCPGLAPLYLGDAKRLAQVINHLLGNAVKFTAQGSITLAVNCQPLPRDRHQLEIGIKDTGIGMTAEQQTRLFRPFEQLDGSITRQFGGTGLGLSICHKLLDLMQGSIQVESQAGLGSTFTMQFELPLLANDDDNPSPPEEVNFASLAPLLGGARVLLATEDEGLQQQIAGQLGQAQLQVRLASSGEQALALLDTPGTDLILANSQLCCSNTRSLFENLAEHPSWHSIPRIALVTAPLPEPLAGDSLDCPNGQAPQAVSLLACLLRWLPNSRSST